MHEFTIIIGIKKRNQLTTIYQIFITFASSQKNIYM